MHATVATKRRRRRLLLTFSIRCTTAAAARIDPRSAGALPSRITRPSRSRICFALPAGPRGQRGRDEERAAMRKQRCTVMQNLVHGARRGLRRHCAILGIVQPAIGNNGRFCNGELCRALELWAQQQRRGILWRHATANRSFAARYCAQLIT